jgi:Fis family transcriptional regulator
MLDGEKPSGLYRMVIRQTEHALLDTVMQECGGNQSRAAEWLGISRGNLRNKLAEMDR